MEILKYKLTSKPNDFKIIGRDIMQVCTSIILTLNVMLKLNHLDALSLIS